MTSTTEVYPANNLNTNLNFKYNGYGWGRFRYHGILCHPLFSYIILCICTFIQNFSVNGANNAVISTIERVFYLNSVQSGLFLAVYDLATVLTAPLVGYLANFYSTPMFFSLNMIIVSFGNIIIGSSNFVNRNNQLNINFESSLQIITYDDILYRCKENSFTLTNLTSTTTCLKEDQSSSISRNAKFLLYLGNFVNGVGSVALFTLGVAYIERIFPRAKAAYCQGIYFAVGTVGGALGIVVTGRFLLLYTKLGLKRRLPSWLTPNNPLWIGCWWLPYFIYGSLCFLTGIIVSGLPNYEIPGEKYRIERTKATNSSISTQQQINSNQSNLNCTSPTSSNNIKHENSSISNNGIVNPVFSSDTIYNEISTIGSTELTTIDSSNQNEINHKSWTNLFTIIVHLMKNTRFIFIVIANLFEGVLLKGFVPFVTKYFEYQHQLNTSSATLITGAIALLSVIIGCPIGAYFMNKYSWTPMQCARVSAIILTISSFLFLFLILFCPELQFQPTSCSYSNTSCCDNIYHPVCNTNEPYQMYLSPCHIGCINQTSINANHTNFYSSCHCEQQLIVSETTCRFPSIPCKTIFILTMAGAALVVFFTAFIQVPMLHVLLYSVPLSYQNMALAIRQTIVRVLGQTTGPLLFGFVFDQTCLLWITDCYFRRTCKIYNNRQMGLSMALSGFAIRFISGVACLIVYLNWKFKHSERNSTNPIQTDRL